MIYLPSRGKSLMAKKNLDLKMKGIIIQSSQSTNSHLSRKATFFVPQTVYTLALI